MKKLYEKVITFLVLCICAVNFCALPVSAATYKIPEKKDFKPNKAANEIETIVNNKSVITTDAVENKVYIDGEAVSKEHTDAVAEIDGYIQKLNRKGMHLNRELVNVVTVKIKEIEFSEFVEVIIDTDNLNKILDVNILKIVLQNNNEYIALDKESISYIATNNKEFRIQIKRQPNAYIVRFVDAHSNIIDKFGVDIKVALPAKNRNQTVYLFMNNTQENWGGQYNSSYKAIEFMTKYSGEYNVASPEISIVDVDDLTDYEKQAINFMVVRGYFSLDNKKFKPGETLTRYDFAESLVRLFFALDNDAICSFRDVDKKHYRYVAASEQSNIVKGFEDGTFKGKKAVSVEQVIALAARTINQKNGYVYPENIEKYLNFTDDNVIGEWAKKEVALAVREGIYSIDMSLKFADDITRKDAAVILYRLFMIMNNTPDIEESLIDVGGQVVHQTFWTQMNAIIIVSAVVLINILALCIAIVFIKKKEGKDID